MHIILLKFLIFSDLHICIVEVSYLCPLVDGELISLSCTLELLGTLLEMVALLLNRVVRAGVELSARGIERLME